MRLFLRAFSAVAIVATSASLLPPGPLPVLPSAHAQTAAEVAQQRYELGVQQLSQDQLDAALASFTAAYNLLVEVGDRSGAALALNRIGSIHRRRGLFPAALSVYEQALALVRAEGNSAGESRILNNIGLVHHDMGSYAQALDAYQQALALYETLGDREGTAITRINQGATYASQGQYDQALAAYQQALTLYEAGAAADAIASIASVYNNIGEVYRSRSQYAEALTQYQQALALYEQSGDDRGRGVTLHNIGTIHLALGELPQAQAQFQQALDIARSLSDAAGEATAHNSLGEVHRKQGQFQQALEAYQAALATSRAIQDRAGARVALNNIGEVYREFNQSAEALSFYQQSLDIARSLNDRAGEGVALSNIGSAHQSSGDREQALSTYYEALAIQAEVGDRAGEAVTLNNIGLLLAPEQPELAIAFLKQSVNLRQAIRDEIAVLPTAQQASYAETVASTYRTLAELLLQQDRILEAQQVLDLLKVQEINGYLRSVRAAEAEAVVESLPQEQQIQTRYVALRDRAIRSGRELTQLRSVPAEQRTEAQTQRIAELVEEQRQMAQHFAEFTRRPEILDYAEQLSRTASQQSLNLQSLRQIAGELKQLDQNAVLIYPLVLDDRLEIVLATADAPPIHRTVPVSRAALNAAILAFRTDLTNPRADATAAAQQLYDWLIRPIAADLSQAAAQTLLYAPDGELRYLPLAALHDGSQWLVERYRINLITADSLTNLSTQPQPQLRILAGAFPTEDLQVQVGNRQFSFAGLPFARQEVETLADLVPDTTELLGSQFNRDATIPVLDEYSVIHFATHATFQSGDPQDSFIVFGDGSVVTLSEIQDSWFLTNVDLVVLSACQTAVGGRLGNGQEILGFGYLMQKAGARAAIASLWSVDDGGTQALMNRFYGTLQAGNTTKAEALRQAQIGLIQTTAAEEAHLRHPYYWAPFILIGNGL